jgi:hypothetical protein
MKAVVSRVHAPPVLENIAGPGWDALRRVLGGDHNLTVQHIPLDQPDHVAYADEEGRLKGWPVNRHATDLVQHLLAQDGRHLAGGYLSGTVVFLGQQEGRDGPEDCDLPERVLQRYFPQFLPEDLTFGEVKPALVAVNLLAKYGKQRALDMAKQHGLNDATGKNPQAEALWIEVIKLIQAEMKKKSKVFAIEGFGTVSEYTLLQGGFTAAAGKDFRALEVGESCTGVLAKALHWLRGRDSLRVTRRPDQAAT